MLLFLVSYGLTKTRSGQLRTILRLFVTDRNGQNRTFVSFTKSIETGPIFLRRIPKNQFSLLCRVVMSLVLTMTTNLTFNPI